MMIRTFLERLYLWCGYAAAAFLIGIGLCIVAQIVWRIRGQTFDATEAAGLCLAASIFLGLAHTFRQGSHVRISLLTDKLPPRLKHGVEIFNCLQGSVVVGFLAWQMILFARQSYEFHDVSPGLLAMPMWIPQGGAAIGITALAIGLLDELIWLLQGGAPRTLAPDEISIEGTVA
jgi:TRAP-type C4-dicarboxylate transport system permease small subunit